jgi:hypothetical protein
VLPPVGEWRHSPQMKNKLICCATANCRVETLATDDNIRQMRENNWDFILNVKPDGNKYLFKMWEIRKQLKERIFFYTCKENGVEYEFSYMNNVCINESNSDVRVNFLHCK